MSHTAAMISFKKTMEASALQEHLTTRESQVQEAIRALATTVAEVRSHALRACPPLAIKYGPPLEAIEGMLGRREAALELKQVEQRISEQLTKFGNDAEQDYESKGSEIREVVRLMADAAESFAARSHTGSQELSECANALEAIAVLKDLTDVRRELRRRVQELRDWTARRTREDEQAISVLQKELATAQNKLAQAEKSATVDSLTGLVNRRGLEQEYLRRREQGRRFSVLLFDLNRFKQVNDRFGHAAGDGVLAEFGRRLLTAIRTTDVACRWGGDEFVALLECSLGDAITRSRQLNARIAGLYVVTTARGDARVSVSASLGVAEPIDGESLEMVLQRADAALYKQKNLVLPTEADRATEASR